MQDPGLEHRETWATRRNANYAYSLNDVTVSTSAAPAQSRQYEYNILGFLTSVCEITGAVSTGCGQNTGGIGYETKYVYDPLGDLLNVKQDYNQSIYQTRTFAYDGLGRMTQESNPESGTVNYTYDTDSTCSASSAGDVVKKIDAAGNLTCFYYDGLHRLTNAGYSGPICRRYRYDQQTVNGVVMPNTAGRLAEIMTDNCGGTQYTVEGFGYDTEGHNTDVYESTPHSGGYYHAQVVYWPNGAWRTFNLPGVPWQTYVTDGEGRPKSMTASSGQSPLTSTSYNAGSLVTGVTYGSGDSDVFTYDNLNRMYTTAYNVGSPPQQVTHQFIWNPNSTLSSLTITDPLVMDNGQACTYAYDALGRIGGSATSPGVNCVNSLSQQVWQQFFTYDPFGNVRKTGSSSWTPNYNEYGNQYDVGGGISYDANGDLLSDTFNTYSWDPNWGNLATVNGQALVFDSLGRMVENSSTGTEYVYAPGGSSQVFATMNGQHLVQAQYPLPAGGMAIYRERR